MTTLPSPSAAGPGQPRSIILDDGPHRISAAQAVAIAAKTAQLPPVLAADAILATGTRLNAKMPAVPRAADESALYWLVSLRGLSVPPSGAPGHAPLADATSMNVVIDANSGKALNMFAGPDPEALYGAATPAPLPGRQPPPAHSPQSVPSVPPVPPRAVLPDWAAFTDLDQGSGSIPAIWLVADQHVMAGVSRTSFAPGKPVTAQEALTALSRLFVPAAQVSSDTVDGGALQWAVTAQVVRDAGSFRGTDPVTQARLVAWVVRALGLGADQTVTGQDARYKSEVALAEAHDLVPGDPASPSFSAAPATREELAATLVRAERELALQKARPAELFVWERQSGSASPSEVLAGKVRTAAVPLPALGVRGAGIQGGALRSSDGTLREDWVVSQGVEGAGHLVVSSGDQSRDVTFAWRADPIPGSGEIWEYPPWDGMNPTVYFGAGTVKVAGLPAPVLVGPSPVAGETVSTCLGACGPGTATLTYTGPSFAFVPLLEMERVLAARN